MSGKTDIVKGRIKEAATALTGNDKLRAEGKADQAVGKSPNKRRRRSSTKSRSSSTK